MCEDKNKSESSTIEREYSEEYKKLREQAKDWPQWRKDTYNANFATSAHARPIE